MPETCVFASSSWRWMAHWLAVGERDIVQAIHIEPNPIAYIRTHHTHTRAHARLHPHSLTLAVVRCISDWSAHTRLQLTRSFPRSSIVSNHSSTLRHRPTFTFRSRLLSTNTDTDALARLSNHRILRWTWAFTWNSLGGDCERVRLYVYMHQYLFKVAVFFSFRTPKAVGVRFACCRSPSL